MRQRQSTFGFINTLAYETSLPEFINWARHTSFPGNGRSEAIVAFTFNNQAYVVTGVDSGIMQTDFWVINSASDSTKWVQLRHISNYSSDSYVDGYTTIASSNDAAFVIGDKAYISTGVNNGRLYPYTWEYDFDVIFG